MRRKRGGFSVGTYSDKRNFVDSSGFAVCRSVAKKYRFFGNKAVFGQQCGQQNVFGSRRAIYVMNQWQQVAGGGEFSDFGGRRTGNDENGNFCTGQFAQRFHGAGNKRSVQEFLVGRGPRSGSRSLPVRRQRLRGGKNGGCSGGIFQNGRCRRGFADIRGCNRPLADRYFGKARRKLRSLCRWNRLWFRPSRKLPL